MADNYDKLVSRISQTSGIGIEEIERKIEAKRAKLSGLVSREGAAQIVAAELGINFDLERMKIAELVDGMRRANIIGKVIEISPVRKFNKNGREGKVCNLIVADEGSNVRAVLWDTHHISLIEDGKIVIGDVVEMSNAGVRQGELHLGGFSDIKKSKEVLGEVVLGRIYNGKILKDVRAGDRFKTRAVIVNVFEPRYFSVCSLCGKRVVDGKCINHGEVEGKKRALLNFILDDGSENIRSVVFGELINKLGLNDEEIFSLEQFAMKKGGLLGEEKFFSGSIRQNQFSNNIEMVVEDILDVNVEELVKELEAKI